MAALWLPHVTDLGSVTRAAAAITGDDEPHVAVLGRAQLNIAALFARWAPARVVGAVLPVSGEPSGAPAAIAADAVEAGECLVVAAREGSWVAAPTVRTFGTVLEPGAIVSWQVTEVPDAEVGLLPTLGSLTEARTGLAHALITATEALTNLDLARWRPEAADKIATLASSQVPDWPLPPEVGADRIDLLARAARLRSIVALAREGQDPAVTTWQSDQRYTALREVDAAARRAMAAATAFVRT
jgi:hypothetical protein